jgi:xylulokinase
MNVICLDIGTTAAKAAAFQDGRRVGDVLRQAMPLELAAESAVLDAERVVQLVFDLIGRAGKFLRGNVDCIAPATMCPAVCLLDGSGKPITPILCHLDRRSESQAIEIAHQFGERTLLAVTGNLPIPGGIASTMLRWAQTQQPKVYRRAARVAPLSTLIVSRLTGRYACDPGSAAFLGTFDIRPSRDGPDLRPWPPMLEFLQLPPAALPEVLDGGGVAGRMPAKVAAQLSLTSRPEVLVGLMDTSAACVHAGIAVGNMYNIVGTTDVLVLCTDGPRPQRGVLTRPVGTGPLWLAISTMAAVGAALDWAHRTFFADLPDAEFFRLVDRQKAGPSDKATVQFDPDLAGSRMRIRQRYGQIGNLRLSTAREEILAGLMMSLARRSRDRLRILQRQTRPNGTVYLGGGASGVGLSRLWPGRYTVRALPEDASLQGLAQLAGGIDNPLVQ